MQDLQPSYRVERFGERLDWMCQNLQWNPEILDFVDTHTDVYRVVAKLRTVSVGKLSKLSVCNEKTWRRYCSGESPLPPAYANAVLEIFPDATLEMVTCASYVDFEAATARLSAAHARWRKADALYAKERGKLAQIAQRYYADVQKRKAFPLVVQPNWLPRAPIALHRESPASFQRSLWPEPAAALDGLNISYVELKSRAIKRYGFSGDSYRLVSADLTRGHPQLEFEDTDYFSYVNSCEVLGIELADWVLSNGGLDACLAPDGPVPTVADLPRRGPPEGIFNLRARPAFAGVNCLLLIRNFRVDGAPRNVFFYHNRTTKTLEAQNTLHVVPAGGHQPYSRSFGRLEEANIWRTAVKEFCEELFSKEEASAVRRGGEDFLRHPDVRALIDAYFNGASKVHLLGLGLDPVTTKPELLVAIVVDWQKAAARATSVELKIVENYEGEAIMLDLSQKNLREVLDHPPGGKPWLPAGAACVQLAIEHYAVLMDGAP